MVSRIFGLLVPLLPGEASNHWYLINCTRLYTGKDCNDVLSPQNTPLKLSEILIKPPDLCTSLQETGG